MASTPAAATGPLFLPTLLARLADDQEFAGLKVAMLAGLVMLTAMLQRAL